MRFRFAASATVAICVLAFAAGCQGMKSPDEQKLAQKRWNDTRSAILYGLAKDQYAARDFEKCKETLGKALVMSPDSPQLHTLSAKVAIEQGQLELAERELEFARKLGPNDPEPYYISGVIYQRWQKPQTALEFYRQAGQRAPAELAYLLPQGEMLVALGRTSEALALLQAKVAYFENSATIRDAVGQLLVQSGRYAEAADMFRQASVLAEDDDAIRERLATAYYYNKQYREAAEVLARVTQKEPYSKRADLFELLGDCQLQLNDGHGATRSFEVATELKPYSAHAWQSLGRAAFQQGDLHRADYALRRAIGIDASDAQTHLLIGYVRVKEARYPEAIKSFERANVLDARDTTALCMIGYTYQKMGQSKNAARCYAQALKIRPGDDMAQQLMAAIDK